ncbi:MAG: hypothetical protein LBH58_01225 [Tannerellaceae bacterium]|jgi:hypothetical protein|nr:hypothetical protein [Tannerellaceae bacterium]
MKKKSNVLLALLAFIPMFIISCSGDNDGDDPVRIGAATIVFADTQMTITDGVLPKPITGSVEAPAGAEISSITITVVYGIEQTNRAVIAERKDLTEVEGSKKGKYTFYFDESTSGFKQYISEIQSILIEAAVKNGDASSREMKFTHEYTPVVEYLSAPVDFFWERVGGKEGTGLNKFGLEWTSNTSTAAIIKTHSETKMVVLASGDWDAIKTKEQLKEAVDNGTDVDRYENVSSSAASKEYDDVLAVDVNGKGEYYIIHITSSSVSSIAEGTLITINGQSKH